MNTNEKGIFIYGIWIAVINQFAYPLSSDYSLNFFSLWPVGKREYWENAVNNLRGQVHSSQVIIKFILRGCISRI